MGKTKSVFRPGILVPVLICGLVAALFARVATFKRTGAPEVERRIADIGGGLEEDWLGLGYAYVTLMGTTLAEDDVIALQRLGRVECLYLANTEFTDEWCEHLLKIEGLRSLDMPGTLVTDRGVETIAKMRNLRDLNLSRTAITERSFEHLKRLRKLEHLNLKNTSLSKKQVESLRSMMPGCHILHLRSRVEVT